LNNSNGSLWVERSDEAISEFHILQLNTIRENAKKILEEQVSIIHDRLENSEDKELKFIQEENLKEIQGIMDSLQEPLERSQERLGVISLRFSQLQISLVEKYQIIELNSVKNAKYHVINSAEILQHNLFNFPVFNSIIRATVESKLISNFKHFTRKLLGNISIQSFVSRSKRQSYKLLPEF
jgi:hypothetical protein